MRLINLFVLLFIFVSKTHAQTAEQIIDNYVQFIGGKAAWKNIKTLTLEGEYDYGGIAFPFTSYAKAPNRYKFIVPLNDKHYTQAYDGSNGWKIDAFKNETSPTLLTGKAARAMANEADVELEDAFINFQEKGHKVALEGKDSTLGNSCYKVKLIRADGEIETYYFDSQSSALIMKTSVAKNPELEEALLTTYYSNYQDVNNIKLPFKILHKSNEQTILTITVTNASTNKAIDDKAFRP